MDVVKKIIEKAYSEGRTGLLEHESIEILAAYEVPGNIYKIVNTPEEAIKAANEIGYPVVAKIVSPDILHKTDAGGVKLNLKTDEEVKNAFNEILENAKKYKSDAKIIGVNIQPFAKEGIAELIIGMTTDPQFGPALMFGLGGIFVEIYKDVSFRVCPITEY
ncbi:MAG: acetate--CoA ligase family protein, partial [Candidatus Helarchaeota archaeon]